MLTEKQSQILQLIIDRQAIDGVTPSYDEMKDVLGLNSKSGIHRLIAGLEARGFVKRLPRRARAMLDLVLAHTGRDKLPSSVCDALDEYYAEVS